MLNIINNRLKFYDNKEGFELSSSKYLNISHIWGAELYID